MVTKTEINLEGKKDLVIIFKILLDRITKFSKLYSLKTLVLVNQGIKNLNLGLNLGFIVKT